MKSQALLFSSEFPDFSNQKDRELFVIYDRYLERISTGFRSWVKSFPHRYGVESGETLKEVEAFPAHFKAMATRCEYLSPRQMTVVVIGGGSVGDFGGFFASVYKRGVDLIHIPTTWLAAIDSSHGGKTALNNGRVKNQLGTFYPARQVILSQKLLCLQPEERVQDAFGELAKIAIIDGGAWTEKLRATRLRGAELLLKFLKPAITAKNAVVAEDPREITGVRQVLNLGHTIGHVFEAFYGWSHGRAITQGLLFSVEMSLERGSMKPKDAEPILRLLTDTFGFAREIPERGLIPKTAFLKLLLQDKKKTSKTEVTFLMPIRFGVIKRLNVNTDSLLLEAQRQGWVRA